jgi:hypothetical protein
MRRVVAKHGVMATVISSCYQIARVLEIRMQIRATIWIFLFGLSTPAASLEPGDTGIGMSGWGELTDKSAYQYSYRAGAQDWWSQPWDNRDGIKLTGINAESYDESSPVSLSLKHRLFFTPRSTVIDAGLGIQTIGLERNDSRNGLRLSLGGRIGIGTFVTLYGESIWLPKLIESDGFENLSGLEFETGVVLNPLPFLSIRAAYRRYNLDYTLTSGENNHTTTQGFLIGTGIHW